MNETLLSEIENFLLEAGYGEHRFGIRAARNGRLVERLRAGVTTKGKAVLIRPETERMIRDFMAVERAKRRSAA